MLPSLQQLRFLVALADELHFGRAADACHVTQSTLSNGIKELEAILGVSLAERSKRSVLLTPVGEEIAVRARRLLADATDLVDTAKRHAGALRGDLRLGAIPTVGPFLVPKIMPRVRTTFPELRFYFREELTESLIAGLKAGRLDAILIALPFEFDGLESVELFDDNYQLATPLDHKLANRDVVTGRDLRGEKLAAAGKGTLSAVARPVGLSRRACDAGRQLRRDQSGHTCFHGRRGAGNHAVAATCRRCRRGPRYAACAGAARRRLSAPYCARMAENIGPRGGVRATGRGVSRGAQRPARLRTGTTCRSRCGKKVHLRLSLVKVTGASRFYSSANFGREEIVECGQEGYGPG
jgi:DNA-binding transcriptional LysR family regulator